MVEELPRSTNECLAFQLSGTLHDEDYKTFVPRVDQAIASQGKVKMLVHLHDFKGWGARALWDDIVFATEHCNKLAKIAIVGETKWEEWMSKVCKPFTMATIKYFDAHEIDQAWAWLEE